MEKLLKRKIGESFEGVFLLINIFNYIGVEEKDMQKLCIKGRILRGVSKGITLNYWKS